jgi:simple sugar transport system substrate-binding protein
MSFTRRKLLKTAAAAAGSTLAMGPLAALAQAPLKIGFVYVSPVGDAGWTFQHDQGRKQMEQALGAKVTTKFVESVPEGADAERVIRELAASGHGLIFTTSFGYMNPTIKVASSFPKVHFEHATGYKTAKNVGIYNARFYEGRYLAGVIAGGMTKSNTLGYVGAFPIPEVLQGMNAFIRGARSVNPKAEMRVIWVNSWYDPGREREAAMTLISQGADVVTHHTDSTAAVQAAEEKGVYAVGYHSDMSKYGPKAHLTAVTHHWGDHYIRMAQDTLAGKAQPSNLWGGMKEGMIKLAPISNAVPADVKAKVDQLGKDIVAGKFHPFTGPVKDQSGKERVAAGKVMTDKELGTMDFYVEGIQGQLPSKK